MNPIRDFVVRVPSAFKDTVDMGGTELYLDTRFNPDDLQIQYGEIVSVPLKWDLGARPGDTLFFHHHVTTNESLHLEGDDYMVIYDLGLNGLNNQAIAYRSKETGELHALGEWVLTEPVDNPKAQETTTSFGIILPETRNGLWRALVFLRRYPVPRFSFFPSGRCRAFACCVPP